MAVPGLAEARWGKAASDAPGDAWHRCGWLFGVWETLDTGHYPHPSMVSMGVPHRFDLPTKILRDRGKPGGRGVGVGFRLATMETREGT